MAAPALVLEVVRNRLFADFTGGVLYVDGAPFGFTCEDPDRGLTQADSLQKIASVKVRGLTAIPLGSYFLDLTYSPKYRRLVPLVCGVPGFQGIRIHSGNTAKDTEGCLLVGKTLTATGVGNSRAAVAELYKVIEAAIVAGRLMTIRYRQAL